MTFDGGDLVAMVAAVISLVAIVFTLRMHRDAGGRIKVKMNIAAYAPSRGTLAVVENGKYLYKPRNPHPPLVELAQIVLENPGRTPVTVLSVELRLEGLQEGQYSVTPRQFTLGKKKSRAPSGSVTPSISAETRMRIDAYDQTTLLFDYLSVLDQAFLNDASLREVNLVAEVKVAGHQFPFTSKRHGYWRIQRHIVSAIEPRTVRRPRHVAVLELVRHLPDYRLNDATYLNEIAVEIEESLPLTASAGDIENAIGKYVSEEAEQLFPSGARIRAVSASYAIRRHFDFLGEQLVPLEKGPDEAKFGVR